ncbi:MAG: ABC transporter permease [Polyangiales bacterium]
MTTRFKEWRALLYQFEQLGVKSFGIGAATAIFNQHRRGVQFAFSLENWRLEDGVRVASSGSSEARELTSVTHLPRLSGSRIAAGALATGDVSMAVADRSTQFAPSAPIVHKLVVPRVLAGIVVLPLLCSFALVLGIASAMLVCNLTFDMKMAFFASSALDSIQLRDLGSGSLVKRRSLAFSLRFSVATSAFRRAAAPRASGARRPRRSSSSPSRSWSRMRC